MFLNVWSRFCAKFERRCRHQLCRELQLPAFAARLEALGVAFDVVHKGRAQDWRDYREADVVVAVRPFDSSLHAAKPPSKLINAWLAGVPALLGAEAARSFRRSGAVRSRTAGPRSLRERARSAMRTQKLRHEGWLPRRRGVGVARAALRRGRLRRGRRDGRRRRRRDRDAETRRRPLRAAPETLRGPRGRVLASRPLREMGRDHPARATIGGRRRRVILFFPRGGPLRVILFPPGRRTLRELNSLRIQDLSRWGKLRRTSYSTN